MNSRRSTIGMLATLTLGVATMGAVGEEASPPRLEATRRSPASRSFQLASIRQIADSAKGVVAIALTRARSVIATGVLIEEDLVLTAKHVLKGIPLHPEGAPLVEVWFGYDRQLERGSPPDCRCGVVGVAYASSRQDFCILRIGDCPGAARPDKAWVQRLSDHPGRLDAPVFALHHGGGRPIQVADGATVRFPYRATRRELSEMRARVGDASLAAEEIWRSYRESGFGEFRNFSTRWGQVPVLGVNTATRAGSSGAPVFDKCSGDLIGILFAGVDQQRAAFPSEWEHHEAAVPSAAILDELADTEFRTLLP